jgi:O-antigen/teichoic acid export membrane protein
VEILRFRAPLLALHVLAVGVFVALTGPELLWVAIATAIWVALKDVHRTSAAVLYGLRKLGATVAAFGGGQILLTGGVVWVVWSGGGLDAVLGVYLLWGVALAAVGLLLVRAAVGPLPWRVRGRGWGVLVRASLPLFVLDLLAMVHLKGDTVLLGLLAPYTEVAAYEAGARLLEASHFMVRPLALVYFPIASALAHRGEWSALHGQLGRLLTAATALGLIVAILVILAAPWIIPIVYGSGFDDSVPVLRLLYASVPGLYVSVVAVFSSNAMNRERGLVPVLASGVALNLILNVILIPTRGAEGAALATIVSQTLMAVALAAGALRDLRRLRSGSGDAHGHGSA